MLRDLFTQQRKYINTFFDRIDLCQAERFLDHLIDCKGLIFFTGIGKSALVAKKVAVTMTSTGTRALYLSPTNALHGDIGMVSASDTFVIFSKSGESDELLNLVPYLRNKGVSITSIVCKEGSRLEQVSDNIVLLPLEKELDPHDLAPTTSAAIQMAFGDIIAVAMMQKKQFHLERYQENHPAGRIGRRMLLKVQDLMLTGDKLPLVSEGMTLINILFELSEKKCGCVLVVDQELNLEGIFTDGDLRRTLQERGPSVLEVPVGSLMNRTPRSITANILAVNALEVMEENQKAPITVLPVLEQDSRKVLGLIKLHDILQSGI